MWHVSSRSGVATLRTAIHLLLVTHGILQPSHQSLKLQLAHSPLVSGAVTGRLRRLVRRLVGLASRRVRRQSDVVQAEGHRTQLHRHTPLHHLPMPQLTAGLR